MLQQQQQQQEYQQRLQQQELAHQQRLQQEHQMQLQQQQQMQQQQQQQQYYHQQQQQQQQQYQQQYQQQSPYGQQRPLAQSQQHQQQQPASQLVKNSQQTGPKPRKVGLDDFNFLAVLGKGNFGKVMLAEDKLSKGLYAIKVLKKEFIIEHDEVASTRSEKRVFQAANKERHPFLVGLHSCFQTETRIYFVMDYVSGGDLMLHIQREQFSERQAKFYACQVLLALEYFHKNNIIYRDLKLDNILLALDGHIKIADYGLCKEDMYYGSTTNTFCGTPEFMAPEILSEQKYGRAVDWWAFGVLIYEMLLGQSPFIGNDEDEIFEAILGDEILYPINMSRDSVSILQKLLTRDPEKRLGSGKTDAEEIKRHPFFKGVNWQDILDKKVPPPFFPKVRSPTDTSNFDVEFTREIPVLTPVHGHLTATDQANFQGFSYVADWV
ncbi:Serine/threonine kinase [Entomortierella chlamydospora]|uniref:protein kinase C n=1 Tax=Entomortierella chlamydospora TaxID=101097 RepID=A0A9P6N039_9FUNG|nr:Serine/threonine kinase [Entomortierella chlamydospora]